MSTGVTRLCGAPPVPAPLPPGTLPAEPVRFSTGALLSSSGVLEQAASVAAAINARAVFRWVDFMVFSSRRGERTARDAAWGNGRSLSSSPERAPRRLAHVGGR